MRGARGGRLAGELHPAIRRFTHSLPFDRRLFQEDVQGSVAHARMLGARGIVRPGEARALVRGLGRVLRELESGRFRFRETDEDIHMAVERRLTELVGPVGGKLHTGRSRNDQVALDLRLWLRGRVDALREGVAGVARALLDLAGRHRDAVLPAYTHLQRAQPVLFAHHLLAYVEMLGRDDERLAEARRRIDVLPLGAGACAGSAFPVDPRRVARELGFRAVFANSLDAVSDRDFVVEFLAAAALTLVHLSRLGEDVLLWTSREFGFARLTDRVATGSSIMPQKRNADPAELLRGRVGRVVGSLVGMLTTLKGLPLSYNRDLQEDKEALFDAVDTLKGALGAAAALVRGLRPDARAMRRAVEDPLSFLAATELADYLAERGVPFREAHAAVGALVRQCEREGRGLADLSRAELGAAHPRFGPDARARLRPGSALARRRAPGGTAPARVAVALQAARRKWG